MLQSRRAPAGLGQHAQLPNINLNQNSLMRKCHRNRRCVTRACAENRLESLIAATAVALMVESSSPCQLSGLGFSPKLARAEALTVEQPVAAAAQRVALTTSEPAPATAASSGGAGAGDEAGPAARRASGALWGVFGKKQADAPALTAAELPQRPLAVTWEASAPERVGRAVALVGGSGGVDVMEAPSPSSRSEAGSVQTGRASALQEDEAATSGGGNAVINWLLERATLVVVGGVVGVGVVRALTSPANRAVDADTAAAALRAAKQGTATGPGPSTAAPSNVPTSAKAAVSPKPAESPGQPPAGHWGSHDNSGGSGSGRRPAGPPGAVAAPAAGRWAGRGPGPAAGGRGAWPPPGPGPTTPSDTFPGAADGDYGAAYPPSGTYYGPPPPPWWRDPYAEYGMPYGPPTPPAPYRGQRAWEEPADGQDAVPGPVPSPQDPYQYYYGAPGGYWGWDAAWRWGPRPPYDAYEGPYPGFNVAPPPPPPQARGFAGMRASPAARLGRNPWAAVEAENCDSTTDAGPSGKGASQAMVVAGTSGGIPGRPPSPSAVEELRMVDAELAMLQAQIDELQGGGNGRAGGDGAAASGQSEADTEQALPTQGRRRVTVASDWPRQLQQEQEAEAPPGGQRAEIAGRGAAVEEPAGAQVRPKQQQQQRQLHSAAASVSPSADQEYERLLQLWREVHQENDDPAEPSASAPATTDSQTDGGGKGQGRAAVRPSADGDGGTSVVNQGRVTEEAAAAAVAVAAAAKTPEEQQQQRQSATAPTAERVPQPPAVVKADREGDSAKPVSEATVTAAAPGQQSSGRSEGRAGPVGWFARMFQGLTGGANSGDKSQEAAAPAPQADAQQPQFVAADGVTAKEAADLPEQPKTAEAAGQEEMPVQEQMRLQGEQEEGPTGHQGQGNLQRQRGREAEAAELEEDEQVKAGAALAAAVEAALQGQLVEQQQQKSQRNQQQQQLAQASGGEEVAAEAPRRNAPARSPASQPRAAAGNIGTGIGASAVPSSPPLAQSKESIQQLKATSAAAADRAAETLARIRAMRAAAQAAGIRSGSGGRSSPSRNSNGNGNGQSVLGGNGNGNSVLGGNGNGNSNGHTQAKLGGDSKATGSGNGNGNGSSGAEAGGAAGTGGATPSAKGAPPMGHPGESTPEAAEAQSVVEAVRQAAEVH